MVIHPQRAQDSLITVGEIRALCIDYSVLKKKKKKINHTDKLVIIYNQFTGAYHWQVGICKVRHCPTAFFSLIPLQWGETHNFLSEHEDLLPCVQKRMRKSLAVGSHCDDTVMVVEEDGSWWSHDGGIDFGEQNLATGWTAGGGWGGEGSRKCLKWQQRGERF